MLVGHLTIGATGPNTSSSRMGLVAGHVGEDGGGEVVAGPSGAVPPRRTSAPPATAAPTSSATLSRVAASTSGPSRFPSSSPGPMATAPIASVRRAVNSSTTGAST